jgi:hypothetical protein
VGKSEEKKKRNKPTNCIWCQKRKKQKKKEKKKKNIRKRIPIHV